MIVTIKNSFRLIACLVLFLPLFTASVHGALPPRISNLPSVTAGLSTPLRIAADSAGNYYLSDPRGGGILKYDESWNLIQTMTAVRRANGLTLTADGNLLAGQGDRVIILSPAGGVLGMLGAGAGQFRMAGGMTIDHEGTIYVTDSLDNCVQIFNPNGTYKTRFGSKGTAPGKFSSPAGLAFEKSTRQLAVADTLNGRVQFFDLSGTYIKTIGTIGSGPLKFTAPQGVAFEYDTSPTPAAIRMYVVDSFQSTVQIVNPAGSGTFIGYVGSYGTANGKLVNPSDVLFQPSSGKLMVVNSLAGTVSQFGINSETIGGGSLIFTVDTPPTITANSSITLTGSVTAGSAVTATVDTGATLGTASYPVSGRWSIPISSLKPGVNQISVSASLGGEEFASQVVMVSLVTTSPTITINPIATLTNVPHQFISGTRQTNDTVSVRTTTNAVPGPVSYPTSTTWEVTVSSLAPGENTITAIASNGSGVSAASVSITLDNTAPSVALASLPEAASAADRVQNIFGITADENIDRVLINGVPATLLGNYFSGIVILNGGLNQIRIVSYDKAGNFTTVARTLLFDEPRPPVVVASPPDVTLTKLSTALLTGSIEAGYTVTVNGIPALINGLEWTATVNLDAGLNTVNVAATDGNGNSHLLKRTIISTAAPELQLTAPAADMASKDTSLVISGTVEEGSTVNYTFNGRTATVPVTGGAFSFSITFEADGTYPVILTATNASGLSSRMVRTIIHDRNAPPMSLNLNQALTTKILSGATESGSTVTVEVGGSVVRRAVAIGGQYTFDLTLVDYTKDNLLIRTTDAAGNIKLRSLYPTGAVFTSEGEPDLTDVLKLMRFAHGNDGPTPEQLAIGDIAPLRDGKPNPNGIIDANDVILALYRLVGLISW